MNNEQSSLQSITLMGGRGGGLPTQTVGHCPKPSQKVLVVSALTTDSGSRFHLGTVRRRRIVCTALTVSVSVYMFEADSFGYAGLHG